MSLLAVKEVATQLKERDKSDTFKFYFSKLGSELSGDATTTAVDEAVDLDNVVKKCSIQPEAGIIRKSIRTTDPVLYLYTSGTTGMPKAVVVKHIR